MKFYEIRRCLPMLAILPFAIHAQKAMPQQERMSTFKTAVSAKGITSERPNVSGIALAKSAADNVSVSAMHAPIKKTVVQTPFLETFDTGLGDFTVIDANNDGRTWNFTNTESYAGNQGVAFYTYSQKNQANDWLVTPGIKMQKDTEYEISFETWGASSSDKERLEVRYGNGATVSDLEEVLVDGFDVVKKYDDRVTIAKKFTPTATGNYYFGFHAMSDSWKFYLFIDNVSIKTVAKAAAPGAATKLSATAAPQGQLKATIQFMAPNVDQNGNSLSAIDSIRVTRKNQTVALIKNPVPGDIQTVADETAEQGNNTYTVVAFAGGNEGKVATVSVYVGQDVPDAVDINKSFLHDDLPSLTATWEPVSTTGANGGYVDPSQVKYVIARLIQSYNGPVALPIDTTDVAATSYDFKINPDEGEQSMADYLIAPLNVAGLGAFNYIDARTLIVGKPYTLPFDESVDDGALNGTMWWYSRSSSTAGLPCLSSQSCTAKEGSCSIGWQSDGKESMSFNTGKITLDDAVNPVLRYAGKGAHGSISAMAQKQNGDYVQLGQIDLTEEWQTKELSLASLKDSRYFIIRFVFADGVAKDSLFLDDIHILDAVDKDLQVLVRCNDKVKANGELKRLIR